MCHNLHFEYTTKEEYENFKNIEDKSSYELKRKINELVKNGQSQNYIILNTIKFVKFIKEEYESYLKQLSIKST